MKEVMDAVEKAFRAKGLGKVEMPPKVYVNFPKDDFRVMPCYIPELGFDGVKIVNSHPENPERYGLHKIDRKAYGFNHGMSMSLNTLLNCYIERSNVAWMSKGWSKAPSREGWRRIRQAGYGYTPYRGWIDAARTR